VIRYAPATSNDCMESEAIVVIVNGCIGVLSSRFRDINRKRLALATFERHQATQPLSQNYPYTRYRIKNQYLFACDGICRSPLTLDRSLSLENFLFWKYENDLAFM
jgi:hypothetical protein